MRPPIDSQSLLNIFGSLEKYDYITLFSDGTAGFTVQREYPNDVLYYPAKTKSGKANDVVLIKVACDRSVSLSDVWIPLRFDVVKYDRYKANHLNYNQDDQDSPSDEEIRKSKSSFQPKDFFHLVGKYYLKNDSNIVNRNNVLVQGKSIIDELYNRHCDHIRMLHIIKQWIFRFRVTLHKMCIEVIKFVFVIVSVKELLTINNLYSINYELSEIDVKNKVGVKGLDFTPWGIFLLCVLFLLVYACKRQNAMITLLLSNNIMIFALLLIAFVVMRYMLPTLFIWLMNNTMKSVYVLESIQDLKLRLSMEK